MSRKFKFFVTVGTVYTSFKELSHITCSLSLLHCHQHLLEAWLIKLRFLASRIFGPSNLVDTVTEVKTLCFHTPKPGTKVHNVTVQDFQTAVLIFAFP